MCYKISTQLEGYLIKGASYLVATFFGLLPNMLNAEEVKIGVIIPLTGSQAVYGVDMQRTLKLIAPDGIIPRGAYSFRLLVEDGQCGIGNSATTAAQKLININHVKFIVAGCSGELMQVAPIAERAKVISIGFAASHQDIRNIGEYTFRTYVDISKAVQLISQLMQKEVDGGIAILTEESSFTLGIKQEMQELLGTKAVYAEDFHFDTTDFRTFLSRAKSKRPSAYYLNTASPRTYQSLFRQMKQLGISEPIYAYFAPYDADVREALGVAQDGVKFVAAPDISHASGEFESFHREFMQHFPRGPQFEFLLRTSYDALFSMLTAIEKTGADPEKVKDYLYTHSFNGALGELSFDSFGDVKDLNFSLMKIANGVPVILDK